MKRIITSALTYFLLLFVLASCQHDENVSPQKGHATFSLSTVERSNGRGKDAVALAYVLLSIKGRDGKIQENIKLELYHLGQDYVSDNLELETGDYELTQFAVLNNVNTIIYATPGSGSELAKFVTHPLPIGFTIKSDGTEVVVPEVLEVLEDDKPEMFGYTTFKFEVVSGRSLVLINTRVVIEVGGIVYENLDARLTVKGFNAENSIQWTKDFDFVGPSSILEIKNGFHHYSIELVNKWGINDLQSGISAVAIWEGRADGPLPVTYVLGGSKNAKKLSRYVTFREVNVSGIGKVNQPESRVSYTYAGGRLQYIHRDIYNSQTSQFEESVVEAFTYSGDVVSLIQTTLNGKPQAKYEYEYGAENKITVTDVNSGIVSTQVIARVGDTDHMKANYSFSNGNSFLYEFDVRFKNIVSDKTTKAGELCSQGSYTYDKSINPFNHLGYVDFNLQNWSASNVVTQNVEYKACSFPSLIPVSHSYTYDVDGYPLKKITTYKNGSGNSTLVGHGEIDFYYE
jgi:hypothetical protein